MIFLVILLIVTIALNVAHAAHYLHDRACARRIAREIPTCYAYAKQCGMCNACRRMPGIFRGTDSTVQAVLTVKG